MAGGVDPIEALRAAAAELPNTVVVTSCNQFPSKAGKKPFLYVGPGAKGVGFKAMFKLIDGLVEALELAQEQPTRFEVGKNHWVTVRFSAENPFPEAIWSRWLSESYAGAAATRVTKKRSTRAKKA